MPDHLCYDNRIYWLYQYVHHPTHMNSSPDR